MLMSNNDYALGDAIGRYRLLGEIARGGMGIVYIAAANGPAGFSKLVALKELRPDLVEDDEFLTMFMEEARMAARLNHPNIVQTNDVDEHNGRHFIAMEYLEGRSLYAIMKRFAPRGGFPQRMALAALRDVLSALDYAHELTGLDGTPLGFVHRDISPHNIFVTFEGHTKVIDFGIAKARDSSLETKTGVLKGRANYMAPEQLLSRADRRSDIFAVGAIMFEILSGRRLWHGMREIEILASLTRGEIPSLHAVKPDTAPDLVRICAKALAARPDERYATAAEMRDVLDHYLWSTGGAPRPRDVSSELLNIFDAERQRTRGLIESALLRLQQGESGRLEALAAIDPRESGTMDSLRAGGTPGRSISGMGAGVGTPSVRHAHVARGQSQLMNLGALRPPSMVLPGAVLQPEPLTPSPFRLFLAQRGGWVAAAGLMLVFVVTTLAVALHHGGGAPTSAAVEALPTATAAASGQNVATAAPAAGIGVGGNGELAAATLPESGRVDTIVFSVSVTPSTAQVLIDGQPMPSNPFLGRFQKGDVSHRVRAVAPGYLPKERLVTFSDNVMIDLSLVPKPFERPREVQTRREPPPVRRAEPQQPRPSQPSAPPASAPQPVAVQPRPSSNDIAPRGEWEPPKRRNIDTNNPYGGEEK
jgi:serine/threonine-protein kinase